MIIMPSLVRQPLQLVFSHEKQTWSNLASLEYAKAETSLIIEFFPISYLYDLHNCDLYAVTAMTIMTITVDPLYRSTLRKVEVDLMISKAWRQML